MDVNCCALLDTAHVARFWIVYQQMRPVDILLRAVLPSLAQTVYLLRCMSYTFPHIILFHATCAVAGQFVKLTQHCIRHK